MTPKEAVSEIIAIVDGLNEQVSNVLDIAINNLYGDIIERVFNDKLDAQGASLGQYSTSPILIGSKSFRTIGSANSFFNSEEAYTDDTQGFRTLKKGKKAFLLIGGYKKLREMQGMQTAEIDLQYKGVLLKSILPNTENGVRQVVFTSEEQADIARGFELRKNKQVFFASDKEVEKTFDFIEKNILADA